MKTHLLYLCLSIITIACGQNDAEINAETQIEDAASISSVTISGNENAYTFRVGISSPDTGCEQYANWWEVLTPEGTLIYRRILGHSHVNEQPFIRSGGPVIISNTQEVIIRMHMNTSGYSSLAFQGSVAEGFEATTLVSSFANELETADPQPSGCAF